jgi:hypothetical protein
MPGQDEYAGASKDLTLAQLADWLWDNEQIMGPVTAIEILPEGTRATLDWEGTTPDKKAVFVTDPDDAPDDSEEVCRGQAYVENVPTFVIIYR